MSSFLREIKSRSIIRFYLYFYLTKLTNILADIIIAQCEYMKNDLINIFGLKSKEINKIVVIYNPIEGKQILNFSLDSSLSSINYNSSNGPFLISIGGLKKQKGFDLLIEAMVDVQCVFPNIILTIYGEGPERMELQDLISKYNLENNIFLKGFNSNPYYDLSKSDLFICSSRYEGFSNSIIESLFLGIPVVATDCPSGVREILSDGENGWLSAFNNSDRVQNLATTIIKALNHKNLLKIKSQKVDHNFKFGKKYF